MMKKSNLALIGSLAVHLFLLVNLRFTAWPEMFSFPYFLSKGFNLYKDMVHAYPPLLTFILGAFFKLFGFNIWVLKIITWTQILLGDLILFAILRKLFKKYQTAILFLLVYVFLQPFLDGNMLWFDNALTLPVLGGFYFVINWIDKKRPVDLVWIGFFLTIAALIKQTSLIYLFTFTVLYFVMTRKIDLRSIKKLFTFPILAFVVFVIWLVGTNSLAGFWNWNIYYPFAYWTKFPSYVNYALGYRDMANILILSSLLIPITFFIQRLRKNKYFLPSLFFLTASMVATYPRFSFFHLQPAFPFFVLLLGIIYKQLPKNFSKIYALFIFVALFLMILPLITISWGKETRFFSKKDEEIVELIKKEVSQDEKVFLLGLNSSYYVFANRIPPKPWIDNFGWSYETPGIQEKVIKGFEKDLPDKIFVRTPAKGNWFDLGVYMPSKIVEWIGANYNLKEVTQQNFEIWQRN